MNRSLFLTLLIAILPGFAPAAAPPATFCNPLNLDYGWAGKQHRHSADPVIVLFKDRYYLFATDDVPGYRVSDDLLTWKTILFTPNQRRLMSDNDNGTYCAPAVATDGKHHFLQYATPGTVTHWYCDTVMEGSTPTGPFKQVDYAPVSLKVGGFMGSAGHSCVFQDKHANWWRVTTLWIGVHDLFERRIGLYPVRFDAAGRMRTDTALGDYPQLLPTGPRDEISTHLAGSWVKSFGKTVKASSSLTDHAPQLAADENCRTWWSAATGNEGEWFALDLGAATRTSSVQVNFAEQDASTAVARKSTVPLRYRAWKSADGESWVPLSGDSLRTPNGPHDFIVFDQPIAIRYLKIECVSMPGGGKFAIRDLRVFGPPAGGPPPSVPAPLVKRHADDDRNATIEWQPVPGADGYLVRFGDAPDRLWQTIQLQGGSHDRLSTHVLNRGVSAHIRIDAFNAHGMTNGGGITAAPSKVQPLSKARILRE
jgi:xylan 1,4-beta-xylosidase